MYELATPINPAAVLKYLSQIMIGLGIILIAPIIVAIVFKETQSVVIYGAIAIVVTSVGWLLNHSLPEYKLELKEAVVLAALIFPISAIVSAVPIYLSTEMSMLDAFFESVSGVTTTGFSVASYDAGPVFLFMRSWLQWIGGIGIVVLVLSVLIRPGTTAFRIYTANVGDHKIKPSVIAAASLLGKVYIFITMISIVLLWLAGMSPFDAVCHALCSVSTGGFSTRPESIGAFHNTLIPLVVILCCLMGATNFGIYPQMKKDPLVLLKNVQVKYFFIIAAMGVLIIYATLLNDDSHVYNPVDALYITAFQALAALTTAGFSTVDISTLPESSKAALSVLMWIGGGMGSTAGGIKIFRAIVLFKMIHLVFMRIFLPSESITLLKINDDVVEEEELSRITAFFILYLMTIGLSTFIFMLEGVNMADALFEVSSALGTVGLSCGITNATMPEILKIVLCLDMLLGRIEIIPLLVLLMPRTWIKRMAK